VQGSARILPQVLATVLVARNLPQLYIWPSCDLPACTFCTHGGVELEQAQAQASPFLLQGISLSAQLKTLCEHVRMLAYVCSLVYILKRFVCSRIHSARLL